MKKKFVSFLFLLWIPAFFAQAAGIQVSPTRLSLDGEAGKTYTLSIAVANPTGQNEIFQVYSDEYKNIIKPQTPNFLLPAGGRKDVEITIDLTAQTSQLKNIQTQILVVSAPPTKNNLSAGTGVKIPLSISISGQAPFRFSIKFNPLWLLTLLPIVGVLFFMLGRKTVKPS